MNAKHLTILGAAGLFVTGCGVTTNDVTGRASSDSSTGVTTRAVVGTTPAASPAPIADPPAAAAAPVAPPKPQVVVVADENNVSRSTFEVALVTTQGDVLASTQVPQEARWTIGAGGGSAYWIAGGRLQSLDEHGVVRALATVPPTEAGRVVISPDGSQWAYATSSSVSTSVITNRIYRGGMGRPAQLVAERTANARHPAAGMPPLWQYYLISWSTRGILVERQPVGGCGCGTPFDMQMTATSTAFIDPATGIASPLAASESCPLSGIGSDATLACFHVTTTGASDSLRFINGAATTEYALSGRNDGGDATFDGSIVAYATVPNIAGGCGGPDWRPETTLHVMDIHTGQASVVGVTGLAPVAWLSDQTILATLSVAHAGTTSSSVVSVNPTTGSMRTVFGRSFEVVGLA